VRPRDVLVPITGGDRHRHRTHGFALGGAEHNNLIIGGAAALVAWLVTWLLNLLIG
jgi:hypothetical protein